MTDEARFIRADRFQTRYESGDPAVWPWIAAFAAMSGVLLRGRGTRCAPARSVSAPRVATRASYERSFTLPAAP
jgi:hypothetical protein